MCTDVIFDVVKSKVVWLSCGFRYVSWHRSLCLLLFIIYLHLLQRRFLSTWVCAMRSRHVRLCLRLLGAKLARIKCRGDRRSQLCPFLASINDGLIGCEFLVNLSKGGVWLVVVLVLMCRGVVCICTLVLSSFTGVLTRSSVCRLNLCRVGCKVRSSRCQCECAIRVVNCGRLRCWLVSLVCVGM